MNNHTPPWNCLDYQRPAVSYQEWLRELNKRHDASGMTSNQTGWLLHKHLFSQKERTLIMLSFQEQSWYHFLLRDQLKNVAARMMLECFWAMRKEFLA